MQGSGGSGSNAFSVMATHGGLQSQRLGVFTRDKMPLFAADYSGSGSSTFYLARVLPSTQDRTLVVDFFDLGDNSCPSPPCNNRGQLKLTTSSDVTATFSCSWTEPPPNGSPSRSRPLSDAFYNKNTCTLDYDADHASNTWDARWVSLKIKIEAQGDPGGYNCTTTGPGAYQNCWIKLIVDPTAAGANISDATTWGARMAGSPVRLVK